MEAQFFSKSYIQWRVIRYDEKQNKDMELTSAWGFSCTAEMTNETCLVIQV